MKTLRRLSVAAIAIAGLLLAFLLVANLALNLTFFGTSRAWDRVVTDGRRLAWADQWPRVDARTPDERPPAFRRSPQAPFLFNQQAAAYALRRYGQVDRRTIPVGVYLGTRTIGPDRPPLVKATKYLANYGLYARHSFILVVPPPTPENAHPPTVSFAAGLAKQFGADDRDHALYATVHPYGRGGYDFPSEGQAIHEFFSLSADPAVARAAPARLETAAAAINAARMEYRVFRRNSNTVIGCLLRASGALGGEEEAVLNSWTVGVRAWAIDFDLPLHDHLPDPAAYAHLASSCQD